MNYVAHMLACMLKLQINVILYLEKRDSTKQNCTIAVEELSEYN